MADAGIKKIQISSTDLPNHGFIETEHRLRYRIVSEDKNRYSHWSPIFRLTNDGLVPGDGIVIVPPDDSPEPVLAQYVDCVWSKRGGSRSNSKVDVFVRWVGGDSGFGDLDTLYPYEELVIEYTGTSLKTPVQKTLYGNEDPLYAQFWVQSSRGSRNVKIRPGGKIFESELISLWSVPPTS